MNVYEHCPEVMGDRFLLRLVEQADCGDLLKVYSDMAAVPLFNSDNCHGDDFCYRTFERMKQAVDFWLWSYEQRFFVRWSIVDKTAGCAVGTIELFHRDSEDSYNGSAVLRLDLRSDYEAEAEIADILCLIVPKAYEWFSADRVITKAKPMASARIETLKKMGFVPGDAPLAGHDGTRYGDYWVRAADGEAIRKQLHCRVHPLHSLQDYRYVVVCSRYQGKWVLSRHKKRDTWETQGGHVEPGESAMDAARRELFEESGIKDAEIIPVCDYCGYNSQSASNGVVFLALVHALGDLPESEMKEIRLFDTLPRELTYPDTTPVLMAQAEKLLVSGQ